MARILVSMKEDFLKSVDKVALSEQRTRSELIREALEAISKKQQEPLQKMLLKTLIFLRNC